MRRSRPAPEPSPVPDVHSLTTLYRGADAVLYRARRAPDDAPVVVKFPGRRPRAGRPGEAELWNEFSSDPGVQPLLQSGTTESGRPYVVTEDCPDGSYAEILGRGGPLTVDEVLTVGKAVAQALRAVHAFDLLHHAVTPANVLRSDDGPVLIDFGSALPRDHPFPPVYYARAALEHAPPEELRGGAPGPWSDVYRLASTLWALLAGYAPFDDGAEALVTLEEYRSRLLTAPAPVLPRDDVPGWLLSVLRRAMAKDPERRTRSVEEFAEALLLEQAPPESEPEPGLEAEPSPAESGPEPGPEAAVTVAPRPETAEAGRADTVRTDQAAEDEGDEAPRWEVDDEPEPEPGVPGEPAAADAAGADTAAPGADGTPPGASGPGVAESPAAMEDGEEDDGDPWWDSPVPAEPDVVRPVDPEPEGSTGSPSSGPASTGFPPAGHRTASPEPVEGDGEVPGGRTGAAPAPAAARAAGALSPAGSAPPVADPAAAPHGFPRSGHHARSTGTAPHRTAGPPPAPSRSAPRPPTSAPTPRPPSPVPGNAPGTWTHEDPTRALPGSGSREGRGPLRVLALVGAALVVLTVLGAGILVLVDGFRSAEEEPPGPPPAQGAAGEDTPAPVADIAPTGVELTDDTYSVSLSWTDNTGGATPHFVVGGPTGAGSTTMADVDAGVAEVEVSGLNPEVEYCFRVVAVQSTDEVAPSEQVCTDRGAADEGA
ncbi:protein kinase domain-containing protein [Nocardiopsis dassonvillei]|uniref:protein kinase domain-containing protein n=1 Tax=Nocardiopsis dassonvillei TaxID=2014 RepID=UPI00340F3805